jgi:hypothetical protein
VILTLKGGEKRIVFRVTSGYSEGFGCHFYDDLGSALRISGLAEEVQPILKVLCAARAVHVVHGRNYYACREWPNVSETSLWFSTIKESATRQGTPRDSPYDSPTPGWKPPAPLSV